MSARDVAALALSLPHEWHAWEAHGWLYAVGPLLPAGPRAQMTLASQSADALLGAVVAEVARQERCLMTPFERQAA